MMRKLSCVVAVIGPMLLITILSAVTWQMNQQKPYPLMRPPMRSGCWLWGFW